MRFLLAVLGVWSAARVAYLRPFDHVAMTPAQRPGPGHRSSGPVDAIVAEGVPLRWRWPLPSRPVALAVRSHDPARARPRGGSRPEAAPADATAWPVAVPPYPTAPRAASPHAGTVLALLALPRYRHPLPLEAEPRRPAGPAGWTGSAWAVVRGDGARERSGIVTPQLGGSQAGVRIARAVTADGRLAVAGRVAAALATRQQEAALGVEWQVPRLPLRIVAEQRFGIENTRGGPTLGIVGGGTAALAGGGRIEGYAQAGFIARSGGEGYADGAARALYPVATTHGVAIDLGAGAWAAAQRGARRVDVGPSLTVAVPVVGRTVRAAVDWRQRIAGDARPGSGLAVSVGTDF